MRHMLSAYLKLASPKRTTLAQVQKAFFMDLSPAQVLGGLVLVAGVILAETARTAAPLAGPPELPPT